MECVTNYYDQCIKHIHDRETVFIFPFRPVNIEQYLCILSEIMCCFLLIRVGQNKNIQLAKSNTSTFHFP